MSEIRSCCSGVKRSRWLAQLSWCVRLKSANCTKQARDAHAYAGALREAFVAHEGRVGEVQLPLALRVPPARRSP